MVCVAPTMEEAREDVLAMAAVKGWNNDIVEMLKSMIVYGDPDTVGEKLAEFLAVGVDGFTLSLPTNGHNTERIGLLAEIARKVLSSAGK